MKKYTLFFACFLLVACTQPPQPTPTPLPNLESHTPTFASSLTYTPTSLLTETPSPTNTVTNTPHPPTATPTPKPITHANIGWEGYDQESRTPFPDEQRIIGEILARNQSNDLFSKLTEEDIKVIWYTAEDGTTIWMPYFTINLSIANNDLFLYVYPLTASSDGTISLSPNTKALDISAMERVGYIDDITNIQLVWNDNNAKPMLAIERNGVRLWYPDELNNVLISYDQDVSAFGLPDKPKPASDYVVVMDITHIEDAYLFRYAEMAITTMGISEPNSGAVYELRNNQWQAVNHPEFIGGGSPQIAFIGYDTEGNGNLYIEELGNRQTGVSISSNIHIPLAPAAVQYEESLNYYFILASPAWSPDGRFIAFIAEENEKPVLAVYDVIAKTWQPLTEIHPSTTIFHGLFWSPDGNWLAYGYSTGYSGSGQLRVISVTNGQDYFIAQGCNLQWYEDNNEPILLFNPNCYSNYFETSNPDGSETGIETLIYKVSNPYESVINYLPAERAYLIHRSQEEDGTDKLLYMSQDTGEEVLIAKLTTENDLYRYSDFIFSSNRHWLLASRWNSKDSLSEVYIQNLETTDEYILEGSFGQIQGWTPDNKGIINSNGGVYDAVTGDVVYYLSLFSSHLKVALSPWGNTGVFYWSTE